MGIHWKNGFDPTDYVRRLNEIRSTDPVSGKTIYSNAFAHRELVGLLFDGFVIDVPIKPPDQDLRSALSSATFTSKAPLTGKHLMAAMGRFVNGFAARPLQKYVFVSSISVRPESLSPLTIRFETDRVTLNCVLPYAFQHARIELMNDAQHSLHVAAPDDFAPVMITIHGRSLHEAASIGQDTLDLIRGIWNFHLNQEIPTRISMGRRRPLNQICIGPIHSLHHPGGELASDWWWYEPTYVGAAKVADLTKRKTELVEYLKIVQRALKLSNYRNDLEQALIRYARALDDANWDAAFQKLWGILELLTDTRKADYKTTMRRTAFMFEERGYHYQVLDHLREHRNDAVHADKYTDAIEMHLFQLKGYVEQALRFHLGNRPRFESLAAAAELLDQPHTAESISNEEQKTTKQLKLLRRARRYRQIKQDQAG